MENRRSAFVERRYCLYSLFSYGFQIVFAEIAFVVEKIKLGARKNRLFRQKLCCANQIGNLKELVIDRPHFAKLNLRIERVEYARQYLCQFDLSIIIINDDTLKTI